MPSKYSSTYTGTFAPSLISLVRSLRTTLPAKWVLSRVSRLTEDKASVKIVVVSVVMSSIRISSKIIAKRQVHLDGHSQQFNVADRIANHQVIVLLWVVRTGEYG